MYHVGMDIVAEVVTGNAVWALTVRGQLVNDSWNNIGVRWINHNNTDAGSDEFGLEVRIFGKKYYGTTLNYYVSLVSFSSIEKK